MQMTIVDLNKDHAERIAYAPSIKINFAPKGAETEDSDEEMLEALKSDNELSVSDDQFSGSALRSSVITSPNCEPEKMGVDLLINLAEEGIYGLPDSNRNGSVIYNPVLKYTEGDKPFNVYDNGLYFTRMFSILFPY